MKDLLFLYLGLPSLIVLQGSLLSPPLAFHGSPETLFTSSSSNLWLSSLACMRSGKKSMSVSLTGNQRTLIYLQETIPATRGWGWNHHFPLPSMQSLGRWHPLIQRYLAMAKEIINEYN